MPMLIYKEKLNNDFHNEEVHLAFNCKYTKNGSLKLKDYEPNYFDSGDFRIKVKEVIHNLNVLTFKKYKSQNNGIYYLALLNYFVDQIPSLYSIKFVSNTSESIYYKDEIK